MHKGGELGNQLMFVIFIFLLLVIAGGIVAGVSIYVGQEYDSRGIDADILMHRLIECLEDTSETIGIPGLFLSLCGIDQAALSRHDLQLRICSGSGDCALEASPLINLGSNFEVCALEYQDNRNIPLCRIETVTIDSSEFTIITSSSQAINRRNV